MAEEKKDNTVTIVIITIVTLILCSISSLLVYKYSDTSFIS